MVKMVGEMSFRAWPDSPKWMLTAVLLERSDGDGGRLFLWRLMSRPLAGLTLMWGQVACQAASPPRENVPCALSGIDPLMVFLRAQKILSVRDRKTACFRYAPL